MNLINKIIKKFKQKDTYDTISVNNCKHEGSLWCNGVKYIPRDVNSLIISKHYYEQKIDELEARLPRSDEKKQSTVAFCMRCFRNSAVPVDKGVNFCHNCGSGGTCISITKDESEYLRETIQNTINNAKFNGYNNRTRL